MAEILNTVSIISFIVAGVFFLLAVVLWFVFRIQTVIGDLSGKNARKSIEQMRQNNEKTGNMFYKAAEQSVERDKPAAVRVIANNGETGLLKGNMAGGYESQATGLLVAETAPMTGWETTAPLNKPIEKVERQPASIQVNLIEKIMLIHTDEVI